MIRSILLIALLGSAWGCDSPYLVFTRDAKDTSCFFRLEERCATQGYSSLDVSETYTITNNQLENFTLPNSPSLDSKCQKQYLTRLPVQLTSASTVRFDFYEDVSNVAAYPYFVYKGSWYAMATFKTATSSQGFVLTEIDEFW